MSKEKQIIEIKECIDAVYGADCAYFDVDGFAIANEIYNAGYRKQSEGEWKKTCVPDVYQCTNCKCSTKMDEFCNSEMLRAFCPNCGAKMKGEGQ